MKVVVIGAGGHGREVADVVQACSHDVAGFLDDGHPNTVLLDRRGLKLLGDARLHPDWFFVLGIGDGISRQRAVATRSSCQWTPALVHPDASVGSDVTIGKGTVVAAGSRLTTHLQIGAHVYVGPNATVGHDTEIDDFATILPGATVSGSVHLGAGSTVGTGANILQGLTVGAGALVGAGAVVTRDVVAGQTVLGVPARPVQRGPVSR